LRSLLASGAPSLALSGKHVEASAYADRHADSGPIPLLLEERSWLTQPQRHATLKTISSVAPSR